MVKAMISSKLPATPRFLLLVSCLALGGLLLLAACSSSTGGGATAGQPTPAAPTTQPPAQPTQPAAQPTAAAAAKGGEKSPAAQVDACKLLTKAEVESAAGRPLGEPVSRLTEYAEPSYSSSCGYSAPGFEAFVSLSVFVGRDAAQAKELYQLHKNAPGVTAAPAAGVGEEAYAAGSGFTALKGRYEVSASVFLPTVTAGQEAAKGLASKMLERLP